MKNLHNVPQVIIDVAENLINAKQENMRTNYIMRLEAIRDYCDAIIKQQSQPKWIRPIRKNQTLK